MPVMNPFGVVAGTLSAGTTRATLGEVVFSNSNGVSFGISGQTITASAAGGGGGNTGSISAGTTEATLGQVVFSNSNGMSFGVNGQTITGSYTVPSVAGLLSNINVSGGTTSQNLSNVVFSNVNNVSFGLNGSTITASASVATSLTAINVSAGTTSNNLSAVTFANSNNVSFGLNGSVVTATATWPIATQVYDVGSAGSTGIVTRYAPEDHKHAGIVRNGVSNVGNTLGDTGASHGQFMFAATGNVTASMSTGVAGTHTIWYSVGTQTNQTVGLYAAGNTTGQSSSSTFDARTISFVGQGIASVGFSNGSVNISVPAGGGAAGTNTLGISNLGNTSGTSGVISGTALQLVLAGGNNITLSQSINGSSATITISAFTQTVQTQGFNNTLGMSNLGNTSGTSGVISGTGLQYFFAGGPNVTLSQSINGQSATLTISGGAGGAGNTGSISAGTTRATLGEVIFADGNGVSFGVNGQTVTASIATSLTAVNISAGTTSNNLSAITFSNLNGVTFGLNGSVITASVAAGGGLTNINVSAGTTSNNLSAITLSNSNNVSFGLNGSVVTATATWPIATQVYDVGSAGSTGVVTRYSPEDHVHAGIVRNGVSNVGNTLGNTGASHGQFMFAASGNITASMSTGAGGTHTIWYSVPAMTNSSWTVSDAASSATVGRLAFTNLNGVTLSLSTGAAGSHTIVGSVATSLTNIRVSAGTTSNNLSAVTFSNGSNVSFGLNGSVITASVNTSLTAINVSAGTTSNNLSAITFSDLNGLTFGLNGSVITGSYTVPGTLSVFAQSNTTQSSSGTIAFNSLQFNGAGIASVGISNGSVVISVPAGGGAGDGGVFAGVSNLGNTAGSTGTVSTGDFVLVGSNGISLSQSTGAAGSAATVTIYGPIVSHYNAGSIITAAGSVAANSSASIVPFILNCGLSVSQVRLYASISVLSTTNTSSAGFAIGWSGVIYSNNAGTLSSINSFSNSISTFHQSNSTSSVGNVRALTANLATASLFSNGEYWMMVHVTTTTSGAISLAKSVSMAVVPTFATGFGAANYFGNNTTNTRGVMPGMAIHSTGATRASLAFTDITGHSGNSASLANLWFELNNGTVW